MLLRIITEAATGIEERYPIEMEAIEYVKDHIYLLCNAHPKVALAQLCRFSKVSPLEESSAESLL